MAYATDSIVEVGMLPMPPGAVSTPSLVIFEQRVRHNASRAIVQADGAGRLVPHVKTHRAPWVVQLLMELGVTAFKCSTPREARMILEQGASEVIWAYPTLNPANISTFVELGEEFPTARLCGLIDSDLAATIWIDLLSRYNPVNVELRVDIDPHMGRTGVPIGEEALVLARILHNVGRLGGLHIYDGHNRGTREERAGRVEEVNAPLIRLQQELRRQGMSDDSIAGGSHTFDLWPADNIRRVSPGSFIYSSANLQKVQQDMGWQPAAFVLASVMSMREGSVTLDAGSKAISPDQPQKSRFTHGGEIQAMSEEHTVVNMSGVELGQLLYLLPEHTCITSYLYEEAHVLSHTGVWSIRPQLGNAR